MRGEAQQLRRNTVLKTVANGGNIGLYPAARKLGDSWTAAGSVVRWSGNEELLVEGVPFPRRLYASEDEALTVAKRGVAEYVQSGNCQVCY